MVTTEAEWISELQKSSQLLPSGILNETLASLKIKGWIIPGKFSVPLNWGDGEKATVQPYFSNFIAENLSGDKVSIYKKSKSGNFVRSKPTNVRFVSKADDSHSVASYEGRRPDFVGRVFGRGGSLSITIVGDWKGRYSNGDFIDQDVGHILDFLRVLMSHVQPFRIFVYGILSDGVRFQFFKCRRDREELMYEQSDIYTGIDGYQIFIGLLCAPLQDIGFVEYAIEGVMINKFLGLGSQSMVFSGEYERKQIAVKVYKRWEDCDAERSTLVALSNVAHVPKLVTQTPLITNCGNPVLLVTPVGEAVQPKRNGILVNGTHIADLISVVKLAHATGILHCDIKPDNIYYAEGYGILLNDWSSAVPIKAATNRYGTYGFYDNRRSPDIPITPSDDLNALVKSAYLMLFNVPAPHPQYDLSSCLDTFWDKLFREGTIWKAAIDMCRSCDYDGLQSLFSGLK